MHPSVKNGSVSVSGDLTVSGNLTISGNTTTLNTETLTVEDNIIILNSSVTGAANTNAGIEVERGDNTNVVLRWNETDDVWQISDTAGVYGNIATKGSIALTSDTTGDYLANITAGTGITITGASGEGSNPTIAIGQAVGTTSNVVFNSATFNGSLTANSTAVFNSAADFNGITTVSEIAETTSDATITSNTLTASYTTTNIFYVNSPSANFTVNITNVPTTNDRMMTLSVIVNQGSTGYIPNALQIDGASQTIKWSGGSAPGATNSKIDIFSFNLFRRSNTWTVLGAVSANY